MSFPRYPKYKESGVEWLGQIPSGWATGPIKAFCSCNDDVLDEATPTDREILYVDISGVDAESGVTTKTEMTFGSAPSRARRIVRDGDVIISTVRTYLKAIARIQQPEENLIVSTGFAVIRAGERLLPGYLGYLLASKYLLDTVVSKSVGVSYPSINSSDLIRIRIPLPTLAEQAVIAAFLDLETAKIDALIAEQERLIELLKEKRQAFISHAVTKGLNPNAPLKASGVEWLAEVPAHWTVVALKHVLKSIEQGWSPQCESNPIETDDEWGVLKVGCVNGGLFNERENKALPPELEPIPSLGLRAADVLVSRANTRELVGSSAVVERDWPKLMLCDKLYRLRFLDQMLPEFATLVFQGDSARMQIEVSASGASASMVNISQSTIQQMKLGVPPREEQQAIVEGCRRHENEYSDLVARARQAIELLCERRSAVISAAVTGQIDVRELGTTQASAQRPYSSGFARQLLAAEILTYCHQYPTTGRVKLQKLLHLCEYVAEIDEINGTYERQAAGPFDNKLMFGVAAGLRKQDWFSESHSAHGSRYAPMAKAGGHSKYLKRWEARLPKIHRVLELLGGLDTESCEIVSTLYAAWNDLLIDGSEASDAEIIRQASDPALWHEAKSQIDPARWPRALEWMKKVGLVPVGFGKRTRGKR